MKLTKNGTDLNLNEYIPTRTTGTGIDNIDLSTLLKGGVWYMGKLRLSRENNMRESLKECDFAMGK